MDTYLFHKPMSLTDVEIKGIADTGIVRANQTENAQLKLISIMEKLPITSSTAIFNMK